MIKGKLEFLLKEGILGFGIIDLVGYLKESNRINKLIQILVSSNM